VQPGEHGPIAKRVFSGVAIALAAMAGLVALLLACSSLWLRSPHGRELVARGIEQAVNTRIHGSLAVGRARAGPFGGRFEELVMRDAKGHEVAHVRRIDVRWNPLGFLRKRVRLYRLVADGGTLDLPAFTDGRLHLGPLIAKMREARSLDIGDLVVAHAQIDLRDYGAPTVRLDDLAAHAALALRNHGREGRLAMKTLTARVEMERGARRDLDARVDLRFGPGVIVDTRGIRVRFGGSTFAGTLQVAHGRIDAVLDGMSIAPADLAAVWSFWRPPGPIRGGGSAHGPPDRCQLKLALSHDGGGRVDFDAEANFTDRKIKAVVNHVDMSGAYFPTSPPFLFNGVLHISGALRGGSFVGPWEIDRAHGRVATVTAQHVSGNGRFLQHAVQFGRIAGDLPGATVHAAGRVDYRGGLDFLARGYITDFDKVRRLRAGELVPPHRRARDRSIVSVDVRLTRRPKHHLEHKMLGWHPLKKIPRDAAGHPE
jgi:hypothetical protein